MFVPFPDYQRLLLLITTLDIQNYEKKVEFRRKNVLSIQITNEIIAITPYRDLCDASQLNIFPEEDNT